VAATDDRHGQVFIAPHLNGGFGAYWENEEPNNDDEPPGMLEEAPPFTEVEGAIAWGRVRAHWVLVRLGDDSTTLYSAGSERLTWEDGEPLPEWPSTAQRPA
jgi:hypothetical protein